MFEFSQTNVQASNRSLLIDFAFPQAKLIFGHWLKGFRRDIEAGIDSKYALLPLRRPDRPHFRNRLIMAAKNEGLARLHAVEIARKMGLGFVNVQLGHQTSISVQLWTNN